MFNPVLPSGQKLWSEFISAMLDHGRKHLTGPKTAAEIAGLAGKHREIATKKAIDTVKKRIGAIIQIRHDWIHNCARPKTAIAKFTDGEARVRMLDIRLFVETFDDVQIAEPLLDEQRYTFNLDALATALETDSGALFADKQAGRPDSLEGKTVVVEFARGGADGSPMPLKPPFGYGHSLSLLSPAFLARA